MNPRNPTFGRSYLLGEGTFRALVRVLWLVAIALLAVGLYVALSAVTSVSFAPQAIATLVFGAVLATVLFLTTRGKRPTPA